MIKINLGCGSKHRPAPWVNCDHSSHAKPDRLFDFGKDLWPFLPGDADEIYASQSLEHLKDGDDLCHVMVEAYRVLIPGGRFEIEVPHPRSDWFIADPTHRLPITQGCLDLFSKDWCEDCQANGRANTPFALRLGVDFRMLVNEQHVSEKWRHFLLDSVGGVKNPTHFAHAVASYNNVLDGMRFVLERV